MSKIEELPAETPASEVPATEAAEGQIPEGAEIALLSKNEKKARKYFSKIGMKKIEGINRVVLRRSDNVHFVVSQPEVFKAGSTYIVFGVIKVEDYGKIMEQAQAMQQQQENGDADKPAGKSQEEIQADIEAAAAAGGVKAEAAPEATLEELKAAGISDDDIEMIKGQVPSVTNGQILKSFNENNKDIVNTILALSS